VLDRCLDGTEALMDQARTLPGRLNSRHLAMESAAIVRIADLLVTHLRNRDPVATRVELTKPEFAWCFVRGAARHLL